MIWNYAVEDIVKGYAKEGENYTCTMCQKVFQMGHIYEIDGKLYDAYGAVKEHTKKEHGMTVDYLLGENLSLTGISEVQQQILKLMSEGKSDKEISAAVGIAASTVRNHRFKLREKEKQAKLFLALMESLEEKTNSDIAMTDAGEIKELHTSATMIDDRYGITEKDREKTIKTYMDENGALKQFPAKEKKKIILLSEIMKNFKRNVSYTEAEVNKVLKRIYEADYPTIRRALIEYGFMDRSNDCQIYRVKE
ncbi:transcriptional regulator, LuxR family [Lachnospiraceae bacterium KM106-2]|nr:transcriptional regulator, LuxR family [Lachnospiraceae bacterium KM106-2]